MEQMNLQVLMDFIGKQYVYDRENYPNMNAVNREEKRAFALTHSVLHMTKTLGRLAGISEEYDHTGQLTSADLDAAKKHTIKMFVNVLKLAEELGLSGDSLARGVFEQYGVSPADVAFEKG